MTELRITKNSKTFKYYGFNENLISVSYLKSLKLITVEFQNVAAKGEELDSFSLALNYCDLNFFEEFGDSCITGFKGALLTDAEIAEKFVETHNTLLKMCQKYSDLGFMSKNARDAVKGIDGSANSTKLRFLSSAANNGISMHHTGFSYSDFL